MDLNWELKNITGKHIKQTLFRLEIIYGDNVPLDIRKIILDELNDMYREIQLLIEG